MFRSKPKPEVLIAGAGPVGLFAGLSLAQRNVDVMVVDVEGRSATRSYALALHPASLRLLEGVGLLDSVLERAVLVRSIGFYEQARRRAEIDLGSKKDASSCIAVLPQSALEELLEDALSKLGVKVRWQHRFARFTQRSEHVEATVEKMVKGSVGYAVAHAEWAVGKSIDFDVPLVIGADGHASLVRRQLGIDFEQVGPSQVFAVFELETDQQPPDEMRVVLDERTTSVLWPLPERRCRWSFELEAAEVSQYARGKDRLVFEFGASRYPALSEDLLATLLRERSPWFSSGVGEIEWRMAVNFERRLATSFGAGRLWLAGDAAHLAGPVGVQSMNVGLNEAKDLADTAFAVLRQSAPLASFHRYETERLKEWRFLQGAGSAFRVTPGTDPWVESRASRLLPCLPASGAGIAAMARQLGLETAVAV